MNIKQLNEELEIVLNEISNATKERVFAKRKEQVKTAQDKLNNLAKRMAKKNIGCPNYIDISFISGRCYTVEDSYEEGELGRGSGWDADSSTLGHYIKLNDKFAENLSNIMGEYLYVDWITEKDIMFRADNGKDQLLFTTYADENNNEPSEEDFAEWKQGKKRLWVVDGFIDIELVPEERPYFIEALKKAGITIEEY